ncbi:hypothetical protein [Leptospira sp. GIMC2001]|uniref:hypothetical protein n=1 Tax=Leptospira sp. GIMC2001 TaxID=1513297 RepID=UPI002348F7B5|nr:hypothetical protein [Leptospira sp. GIMC2001]WCL49439.1 hypothetical protein O4O04_19445 [Leptospira sp. GIMC2001]
MISRNYLPVHFRFFFVIGLLYFAFVFTITSKENPTLPEFSLHDQFGKAHKTSDLKGKSTILVGCLPQDRELCRRLARKIFWKIQTYSYGQEEKIVCLGYLSLGEENRSQIQPLEHLLSKPGYEPILLDWNNQLREGIIKGKVYVRGFNRRGKEIVSEQWTETNNQKVKSLFEKVMTSN